MDTGGSHILQRDQEIRCFSRIQDVVISIIHQYLPDPEIRGMRFKKEFLLP